MKDEKEKFVRGDIAIIGMNGRFPGASSVTAFFENLKRVQYKKVAPVKPPPASSLSCFYQTCS